MEVVAVLASSFWVKVFAEIFWLQHAKAWNTPEGKKFWWQVDMNDGCWHFKPVYFNMMHISGSNEEQ